MTTDEDDALSLVRDHLRQIEPPVGAKARVSLELEERIVSRTRSVRPLWALGLLGALVAGVSLAANGGDWFRTESPASPALTATTPAAHPTPSKQSPAHPTARDTTVADPSRDQSEPGQSGAGQPEAKPAAPAGPRRPGHLVPATRNKVPDTTLARQVADLQAAMAYAEHDDERALAELRSFKRRWPASPLNQEADIEIVAALQRLGRDTESRAAARRFVNAHPGSAKVDEMKAISNEAKAP